MAKKFTGVVESDVRDKTLMVVVTRRETHPIYGKQYTVSHNFTVHDEKNEAKKGDRIEFEECRPLSKTKHFTMTRIVEVGHGEIELKEETELIEKKEAPQVAAKPAEKDTEEATK